MTRNGLLRKVILLTVVALAFCPCRTANAQEGITENPGSSSPVDRGLSYALTGNIINSDSLTIFANNNGQLLYVERNTGNREYAWEWMNGSGIKTTSTLNLGPYSVSNGTAIQNNALAHAHTAVIQNGGSQTIGIDESNGAKLYMTIALTNRQTRTIDGEQVTMGTLQIKFWVDIGGQRVELTIAEIRRIDPDAVTRLENTGFTAVDGTGQNYFSIANVAISGNVTQVHNRQNAVPATSSIEYTKYTQVPNNEGGGYYWESAGRVLNPSNFPLLTNKDDPTIKWTAERTVTASGYLTINSGKIEGTDTAIGSVGTLNVNNTFIQAGQIGILQEYRWTDKWIRQDQKWIENPTPALDVPGALTLENSQIGNAGNSTIIEVNSRTGLADLLGGKVVALRDIQATRVVTKDLDKLNGPIVGILTQFSGETAAGYSNQTSGTSETTVRGYFLVDNPPLQLVHLLTRDVADRAEREKNTEWRKVFLVNTDIYAMVGISFGGENNVISIDKDSGIYASTFGITDFFSTKAIRVYAGDASDDDDNTADSNSDAFFVNGDRVRDGTGVTNTPQSQYGTGYSGTWNQIRVDGKVIAGQMARTGVQVNPVILQVLQDGMSKDNLGVYYKTANGNIFYDPLRAAQFERFTKEEGALFVQINGTEVQLTEWNSTTGRWEATLDPATGKPWAVLALGTHSHEEVPYIANTSGNGSGIGIYLCGDSLGWEAEVVSDALGDPWSTYYGPVVDQITVRGADALIQGGQAAIQIGSRIATATHVSEIWIGENNEVNTFFHALTSESDTKASAANLKALNDATREQRAKLFFNPDLLYDNDPNKFHFDNAGVHGDIISYYNGVAGVASDEESLKYVNPSWIHYHGDETDTASGQSYMSEMGISGGTSSSGTDTDTGSSTTGSQNSYVIGHRDLINDGYHWSDSTGSSSGSDTGSGTTDTGSEGRSVILDEILIGQLNKIMTQAVADEYAASYYLYALRKHNGTYHVGYREVLDRFLDQWKTSKDEENIKLTGLTKSEIAEGYTRDGTLLIFSGGDIFSGNIYGGGYGDRILDDKGDMNLKKLQEMFPNGQGNIDLRIQGFNTTGNGGTTIFNNNEVHVRDLYILGGYTAKEDAAVADGTHYRGVESNWGHLILNDSTIVVNRFMPVDGIPGNYADGVLVHDVLNEGIVSGNGTFKIAERLYQRSSSSGSSGSSSSSTNTATTPTYSYYDGYFINHGILAPGLPGYVGDTGSSLAAGGQIGVIEIHGAAWLIGGRYDVTTSRQSIGDYILSYNSPTAPTGSGYTQTEWETLREEKLSRYLQWFSSSRIIDPKTKTAITLQEQLDYLSNPQNRNSMDELLMRYGMSDVLDFRIGDEARNDADVRSRLSDILLKTVLGGVIQVDDLYDPQTSKKTKKTAFIVMVSDAGFSAESSPNSIDISASQQQLAFANISYLPENLANGQTALVLTMSDDAHFYQNYIGNMPFNAAAAASAFDAAQFTNPGLALSLQFGLNDPAVLRDVLRQMASSTRANSMVMSLLSPYDHVFNQIGYGQGGMSTGRRGDVIFRNLQNGQFVQPYGQPAVPPPGQNFVPPVPGQYRGQNPKYRTGALWATLNSTSGMRGDDGNSFKFSFTKGGAMVGSEWNLSPSCAIGAVATAYYGNMKEWDDEVTSFDYSAGLYLVAAPFDQFEIRSFAGIGFQTYKMNRYIRNNAVYIGNNPASVFGINDHYDGETQGYSCNFTFEFSRPFTVSPNFVIRPALAIEYQYVQQDGFTEHLIGSDYSWTNSGYNQVNGVQGDTRGTYALQYSDMTFGRFLPRIGISTESHYANGGLQFRAAFLTPFLGERYAQSRQQFVSGSPLFRVRGADLGAGYLQFGGGGHFWIDREHTASVFADGDVYLGSFSTFNVSIGIQQNF